MTLKIGERIRTVFCNESGAGVMEAVVLIAVFMVISTFLMVFLHAVIGFGTTRSDFASSGTGFWRGNDTTGMKSP